ncbi:hypothetical protein BAUCODRAFT_69303 [Baudoinia panamericana UAMH 10762]|uniref:Autophagy-related protein 101 n=1 Tax=Baudoinia panamericana (strain UAMH 10762) TaxID=717646 RepID=M2N068_BAUPA|nr:uncharacterized protein BAUCODRAFT_69303 [Baudoinia panamericana UAMH 10762]EMC97328.1 hypothetical protein BAUCODRAFT_69303 [Baudoinia panamericana UAMH 10762]
MEARKAPEFMLELSADRTNVKDVVKGICHIIFFQRYFQPLTPATHDVLDVTLPYVSEEDIESLIERRTTDLVRALDVASTQQSPQYSAKPGSGRGVLIVQFLEKKRRKGGFFFAKADEETVWENWIVDVSLTSARSETEAGRNRHVMEDQLQQAAMKVVALANREKAHIPPITTNDTNPFPYQILVNPRTDGWGQKLGIF